MTIAEIRKEINERRQFHLADQNRDSALFLRLIDALAEHVEKLAERTDKVNG